MSTDGYTSSPVSAGTSACCTFPPYLRLLINLVSLLSRCITGAPGQRLSRGEESCIVNCVERFLDTSLFLMRRVQEQRQEALNH